MARYRMFEQAPQFADAAGVPYAGGTLTFTESGGTTPKNVYTLPEGGSSLGNVLTLGADGRYNGHFWLDGIYRCVLKDADGVTIHTSDDVRDVAGGGIVPLDPADGNDQDVYSTDGVDGYWRTVREMPDPTGHDGEMLIADGDSAAWQPVPAAEEFGDDSLPGGVYQSSDDYTQVGKMRTYYGSGSAPTAGGDSTSVVITGMAFVTGPVHVSIEPTIGSVTQEGAAVCSWWTSGNSAGFTANFRAPHEDISGQDSNINSAVTFTYSATGLVA